MVSEDSYNGCAVLRLDLRSDHEREDDLTDLLRLIVPRVYAWFDCDRIVTKAVPAASDRIQALRKAGFVPEDAPLIGHDGTQYGDYWTRSVDLEADRRNWARNALPPAARRKMVSHLY